LNPSAIAKIFEVKNRPADNPLICHFHSIEQVKDFVTSIPATTLTLIQRFSPGPISFMLDLPENSPLKFATCGSAQVIVRIPDHPIFLEIIKDLNHPVAAPSANTSGRVSPTSAEMVEKDLGEKIEGIVDGGISRVGIESTIVDARNDNEIFILRRGAIGETEIQKMLPRAKIISVQKDSSGENISDQQTTPGTKYRHYAPATPVFLINDVDELPEEKNTALLVTEEQLNIIRETVSRKFINGKIHFIDLGSITNLDTLAKHFYRNLASLDQLGISRAFFLRNNWGESSLGKALQNRIEKIVAR
jgi:L-threonylcarbamoyladenylate synthase